MAAHAVICTSAYVSLPSAMLDRRDSARDSGRSEPRKDNHSHRPPFTSLNMDGARQSTHPRRELMQVVASASALSLVGPLTWRRLQMLRNSCPQDLIQHCFHDLAQLALAR